MELGQKEQRFLINGLLILVLLLAFGLRLYHIQAQSLWNDEGTSIALAARDLATITEGAAHDIHPPLYYYVLHFWMMLFGNSELAVRSLSALLGTLLVLLTFVLGRHLTSNTVGLIAAFFAALSPFQVYYSQETRMYALCALLGSVSIYTFLRLLSAWQGESKYANIGTGFSRRSLLPIVYVFVTALLLYTHYFAMTIIVVQNLAFLWWWTKNRLPKLSVILRWGTLQVIVGVLYLPWLLLAARQLRVWPAISEPLHLPTMALDLLRVFSLGLSIEAHHSFILAGFALLLLLGMIPWPPRLREVQSTAYVTSLLYLFVPICIMYVLSLQRPMYNPKFLLLCTPPFYLFLARGTVVLLGAGCGLWLTTESSNSVDDNPIGRPWSLVRVVILTVVVIFVAGSSLYSLHAYYYNPLYARDNYRGIAQYIQAVERENDAILINAPGQIDTFAYYYRGKLPIYALPRQRPLDKGQTEADLEQMIAGRERIFAVLWATDESDPERFVEGWLDQHAYKAMDSWYGNVRFVIYAVPAKLTGESPEYPLNVNLGDKVRLLGYSLPQTEVISGDILQLTLFWQAITPMDERYKVFTHVLDEHGHLVGQRDAEPGGGAKITTIWQEGERVVDNYGLPILPATPPGDYMIEIGMYSLSDGVRLPVLEDGKVVSDHILLRSVRILPAVAPPPLSVLDMKEQLNARFGDVKLLGYNLTKLGYEHQPNAPIHPGDVLHLTLFWQASSQPSEDIKLILKLQDAQGTTWLEHQSQPTEGLYPACQWAANEVVRDQHNLPLSSDLAPGRYYLYLSVQQSSTGQQIGPSHALTSVMIE